MICVVSLFFIAIFFEWNLFMSSLFFHANEIHLFIDNKIRIIDKKITQSCWTCRLSNRLYYVMTKIFEKCVFCAISSKIIKKYKIIFIEYVNIYLFHNDFVNVMSFSIFDSTNDFFVVFCFFHFFHEFCRHHCFSFALKFDWRRNLFFFSINYDDD